MCDQQYQAMIAAQIDAAVAEVEAAVDAAQAEISAANFASLTQIAWDREIEYIYCMAAGGSLRMSSPMVDVKTIRSELAKIRQAKLEALIVQLAALQKLRHQWKITVGSAPAAE